MATLGYVLVLIGLACAVFTAFVGFVTGFMRKEGALPWVQRGMYGFCAAMMSANLVMIFSLVNHDFSVKYVQQVGSRSTPLIFTIVSLWSALEGSILFWGAIMSVYLFVFTFTYRKEHGRYMQLTLGTMGAVAAFFAFLIAAPAQPWFAPGHLWEVPTQIPLDGPGPNPLLQNHPLMIIHPPMLYLGYVGMTVPFGIAVGALLRGELGDAWLVPLRKWTLVPWMFLSVGIILGGWWAYAVLGWGGYWAWDPVENASFMPWLTATAFMHSTMVLERKKSLKLWTLALALSSFVLTIIGTFMTRSGVFNSVHSFTQSDIGPTFLVFIAVITLFSIILLAVRGNLLIAESSIETVVSREGAILVNNLVFVVLTATVFLGTTYPLVTEALAHKKISVGEPYFNTMALPTGILMLFLMGVGPMLPWGAGSMKTVTQQLTVPTIGGVVTALIVRLFGFTGVLPLLTFGIAGFVTLVTLRAMALPALQRAGELKESVFRSFFVSAARTRRRTGGYVVHLGVVMIIVAIAASRAYPEHSSETLAKGASMPVGAWKVRFDGISSGKDERRDWVSADVTVISPSGEETTHHGLGGPRMNYYPMSNDPVGSPMVHEMVIRDVYVSLQHIDQKTGSASFNAWVFPLVGWIWYALPVLVLGTLIALWPQRKERTVASTANPEIPGGAAPPQGAGGAA